MSSLVIAFMLVDYNYFMEHTGHGNQIATKGTPLENWHEKEEIRMAEIREKRRQEYVDYHQQSRMSHAQQDRDASLSHNPPFDEREDLWRLYGIRS
jgi:hypothetical protein